MHALITSPFIRRELQLPFYANETTSPVYGRYCREGEHSIDFYLQCFNNPETVMSTAESEHDKTNTMTCVTSELYYQSGHPQSLLSLRRPSEEVWILGHT